MVKIVYCISKLPHLSNEEFHHYWREVHGPIAGRIPGCRKYVQSHTIHRALNGRPPAFDGVAELWFDDQAALEAAALTPEMKALHADGAKFIGHIKSYVVEEKTVIG